MAPRVEELAVVSSWTGMCDTSGSLLAMLSFRRSSGLLINAYWLVVDVNDDEH